jgi:integrase
VSTKRPYGTGSLTVRTDKLGRESWFGRAYIDGQRVNRKLGPKRQTGSAKGLTQTQAESALRRLMDEAQPSAKGDRLTLSHAGERYLRYLEGLGRKRATVVAVESALRVWLNPHLGDRSLEAITPEDIDDLIVTMRGANVGIKSVRNYIGTLSAIYRFAQHPRRRWATSNPVDAVELPQLPRGEGIKFLTMPEVERLAAAAVGGDHQALDRTLYLVGAMTGLRQGELIALRWADIDWRAHRIRVRRSHVLGEFDEVKSSLSLRAVPMSSRVTAALKAWRKLTPRGGDDALVFAEPTGEVLRRGALMRRYRRALETATLPAMPFHALRHTFATSCAAAGVPLRTLQEWLGHRDLATVQRYASYSPNEGEVAMVDRAFGS